MATTVVFVLSLFILPMLHCDDSRASLKSVINSLEKLVSFYKTSYTDINVDGLFGLRAVQGHINLLLSEHEQGEHQHVENKTWKRLHRIATDCAWIGNYALEFVKRQEEAYYKNFQFVISGPWGLFKKHREIDPLYKWKPKVYSGNKNSLDEDTSDKCMGELTGDQRSDKKKCIISDFCLNVMTKKGRTEYGITHQILWTMLAEKAGCLDALNKVLLKKGYSSVAEMQLEFCTNNYYEMVAVVHIYMKGNITSDYQDLFLEQQFVCPSVGFYQYLKKTYLTQIFAWQHESGCFGEVQYSSFKDLPKFKKNLVLPLLNKIPMKFKPKEHPSIKLQPNIIYNEIQPNRKLNVMEQIESHHLNGVKTGMNVYEPVERKVQGVNHVQGKPDPVQPGYKTPSRQTRKLLVEKILASGCLAHKTAVAGGALVMYLRYLIDPGALNLTSIHPILPESSRSLLEEAKLHDFQNQKVKGEELIPVRQELGEELVLNQADDQEAVEDGEDEDGGNAEEQTEEEEEDEDMDDVDNNYKEDDEMYPEKEENPNIPDRKVVRFGNGNKAGVEMEKNKFENDDNIQDREIGDKVNLFQAGVRGGNPDQQENKDDEEYTYYDPPDKDLDKDAPDKDLDKDVNFEKKEKDPSVQKYVHRNKKKVIAEEAQQTVYGSDSKLVKSKPDDRTLFIVISTSILLVIFLMYRFIKKRRIHIRFTPRKVFKL